MASTQQPTVASEVVGNAFVHQYYHILHQSPELVHRFYQNISKLGRPEPGGIMSCTTTMQAINEKILSLEFSEYGAEIKTVDAQESLNGGVLVLVTGYLTGKDHVKRSFTQSFFLAPQDKGFFVLNDMFRYMDEVEYHGGNGVMDNGVVAPPAVENGPAPAEEHRVFEQPAPLPEEEDNVEEVYNPSENGDGSVVEEETPVAEVVDEIPSDVHVASESSSAVQEETPKKSYASIVKVAKESMSPIALPTSRPARPPPANHERQMGTPPPPSVSAEVPVSGANANESINTQDGEADGHSIYIKNLPLTTQPSQLEEAFKRFGPIKSGGIQVRSNKLQGFCFGFVEFEEASAMQSAIEASPILIGGRSAFVEEKRHSGSRVNNRGRYPPGRGSGNGFRNEGGRGRGNYGSGRGYGRGDFNNRAEFNNRGGGSGSRGGSSNRGADGAYQKADQSNGNNGGGRPNRSNGFNATTKPVAPRVPAPA